jgi:hypothetical protein
MLIPSEESGMPVPQALHVVSSSVTKVKVGWGCMYFFKQTVTRPTDQHPVARQERKGDRQGRESLQIL